MKVTLNACTPLVVCSNAIRECWQSQDKSDNGGEKDIALIDRVGNQYKHSSTLEHLTYSFTIEGISRACLQELARHRMTSLSVKSTRYVLANELKNEKSFLKVSQEQLIIMQRKGMQMYRKLTGQFGTISAENVERASKFLVLTGIDDVDYASIISLEMLRQNAHKHISNDKLKYSMPENFKTSLAWTLNARSLQNFLTLRSSKAALWEIRNLAIAVYLAIPEDHKFLFHNSGEIRLVSEAMKSLVK